MKWLVGLVLVAFFSNAAFAQTGKSPDWHSLQLPEYYNENLKKIEAENTELIVDSFIKYFWKKPVGTPLDNTQISVVQTDKKGMTILSKGSRTYSKVCAKGYIRSKQLIFFNAAATRTLNGRHADNYQFSMLKNVDDEAGNCRPIPDVSPAEIASTTGHYIPSRPAQAIYYALKQKGVDLGHCGIRQRQGAIPNLKKLVVIDCYLESHGFNKKQSATMANIYPTVSIATYGNNFLGLSVYDATYSDSDVGKTREEIYAEYRTDAQKNKDYSNYLKQYIGLTQANKAKLNTAYFQHLDRLPDAPHFKSFTPEDVSNTDVVDKGLGTTKFPLVYGLSNARRKMLLADRSKAYDIKSYEKENFTRLINRYERRTRQFSRPLLDIGPDEARILSRAYSSALKISNGFREGYGGYWIKKAKQDKFEEKSNYYRDLSLALGSPEAYYVLARELQNAFFKTKDVMDLQNFVVHQTELLRLYQENNPNFAITGYEAGNRAAKLHLMKRPLYGYVIDALKHQSDIREGPKSSSYSGNEFYSWKYAPASSVYPRPFNRCESIYDDYQARKIHESQKTDQIRPLLEQCIRAAPNSRELTKYFNIYYTKYYSAEAIAKFGYRLDVLPVVEKKYIEFGKAESAETIRSEIDRNAVMVAANREKWRGEVVTENARTAASLAKSNREWHAARAAKKLAEAESVDAYYRERDQELARARAEYDSRQSTGQMISDALGNIVRNQPSIAEIERDANARIAASRRQALAQQRAERQRTAAAAQTQRDQAADRARQQRAAQQSASEQRIAQNRAARQREADRLAAQKRESEKRAEEEIARQMARNEEINKRNRTSHTAPIKPAKDSPDPRIDWKSQKNWSNKSYEVAKATVDKNIAERNLCRFKGGAVDITYKEKYTAQYWVTAKYRCRYD